MRKPKAMIVSHKFNPGHYSHLIANQKLLFEAGYDCTYYWAKEFDHFTQHKQDDVVNGYSAVLKLKKGDLLIVWFPSLRALFDMFLTKFFTSASVIYIFHEPVDSVRAYIESGFGLVKTARIMLISLINRLLVALSDKIILPSENAFQTFKSRYRYRGQIAKISLMFDDECSESQILSISARKYFSYIGTIAEDHAFDEFVKFIVDALRKNELPDFNFLIASRSKLPNDLSNILADFKEHPRLKIVSGRPLSNDEINSYFSQSIVVWNAYRRSMQSGVLPKAFMFGTPVLISEKNRSEYFENNKTGIEISLAYKKSEIYEAIYRIQSDFQKFSNLAREKFLSNFYYKSLSSEFIRVVNQREC